MGDDMKILGAVLALLGIAAIAVAAIQHFNRIFAPDTQHLSLYIAIAGVIALLAGAVLGRVGGEDDQ
jgi:hypothetical protein